MPVDDVVRLKLHYTLLGSECQSGFSFRFATPAATNAGLVTSFTTEALTEFRALQTADASHVKISVDDLDPGTGEGFEAPVSPALPGTAPGTTIPPQDALVLSLHTGFKGKRFRGRTYVSALSETQTQLGRAEAALLASADALAAALIGAYGPLGTDLDYRLVVFSPEFISPSPPNPPSRPGTLTTQVTSITIDDVIRSQRRRQIGVGA